MSGFAFKEYADRTPDGKPVHLGCHNGLIFVFEQIQHRPRTVILQNVDNIDGDDPDPAMYGAIEQLPAPIRQQLRVKGIRYRSSGAVSLAGVMG